MLKLFFLSEYLKDMPGVARKQYTWAAGQPPPAAQSVGGLFCFYHRRPRSGGLDALVLDRGGTTDP